MACTPNTIARHLAPFLLTLLVTGWQAYAQSVQMLDIDTAAYPTMRATVVAYDAEGVLQWPLKDQLQLVEDGQQRTIDDVSCPTQTPSHISSVLTFDCSVLADATAQTIARSAARAWVRAMDLSQSECAITGYRDRSYVWLDHTSKRDVLLKVVDSMTTLDGPGNLTAALSDTVTGALHLAARGSQQRVVVVMAYGQADIKRVDSIVALAKATQCTVYAVLLFAKASGTLKDLVVRTGGQIYEDVRTEEQAVRVYRTILRARMQTLPCTLRWKAVPRCDVVRPAIVELNMGKARDANSYSVQAARMQPLVMQPAMVHFRNPNVGRTMFQEITVTAQHGDVDVRKITSSNSLFAISPTAFRLLQGESKTLAVQYHAIDSTYTYTDFTVETDICDQQYSGVGGVRGRQADFPQLKITSPTVDSMLVEGGTTTINWKGVPHFEKVRLDYSSDDGSTWNVITLAASEWQYRWMDVPSVPTKNILLRAWQQESLVAADSTNPIPELTWQHALGGIGDNDQGYCIAEAADGGILVAGSVNGVGGDVPSLKGGTDIMVLKLDPANGKVLWSATMGGRNYDAASSVIGMPDNSVVVAGYIATASDDEPPRSAGWTDAWLAKYDGSTGRKIWERVIGGGGHDRARCVIRASDGSVVFVGTSYSSEAHLGTYKGDYDIWIGRLNAETGDVLKLSKFGGSGADIGIGIIELPDGSFAVCGSTTSVDGDIPGPLGSYDGLVLRIDPKLDSVLWRSTVGTTGLDRLTSLIQVPDGAIMLSGMVQYLKDTAVRTSLDYDAFLTKIDVATGQQLWQRRYGGSAWEVYPEYDGTSRCLTRSVDGNIVLATSTYSKDRDVRGLKGQADFWVVKVNPDSGDVVWRRNLGGASRDYAHGIVETADGSLFVVGQVESNDGDVTNNNGGWSFDWWVVRLDEQATLQRVVTAEAFTIVQPTAASRDVDVGSRLVGSTFDTTVAGMVVNTGGYPFAIRDITISGADAASFDVVAGIGGQPLAPSASRTAAVRFRPERPGVHQAVIRVATQSDTLVRTLRGQAVDPTVAIVHPVVDFGMVRVHAKRDSVRVPLLRNTGTTALAIRAVRIGAPNTEDFTIGTGDTATLAPGEHYTADLRFAPAMLRGITTATLFIDHDGIGSPAVIQLLGRGVYDTVRTTVAMDTISAEAGQRIELGLRITAAENLDVRLAPIAYTATIEVNPTVVHLVDPAFPCLAIDDNRCRLTITGIRGAGTVLERIPAMATIGTTNVAPLLLVDFRWLETVLPTVVTTVDGFVRVGDGCVEGGYRLFIPSGAVAGITCRPNPAETTVELVYGIAEPTRVTIDIMDRTGRVVRTLINDVDMQAGLYTQQVDVSQLSVGPYMVALRCGNVPLFTRLDIMR